MIIFGATFALVQHETAFSGTGIKTAVGLF